MIYIILRLSEEYKCANMNFLLLKQEIISLVIGNVTFFNKK